MFQKIVKNILKIEIHFFLLKKYALVPKFPIFSQISKSGWNDGDGDVDGDGEKFFMGKCCENEMT